LGDLHSPLRSVHTRIHKFRGNTRRRHKHSVRGDQTAPTQLKICLYALEHRELSRQRPLLRCRTGSPSDAGCAGQAQSAYESRGNRIRQRALGAQWLFFRQIVTILTRTIFPLLYRNLMDVCQIWCEERGRAWRPSQRRLRDAGAERRQGRLGKASEAGLARLLLGAPEAT
jgi:hypothetical protein